ncbi:hypothetical protein DWX49_17295 [Blautia sp. AF19-34]|nr:hypothetical protein DWX49_17295 [Blautia sp. AF19-34]
MGLDIDEIDMEKRYDEKSTVISGIFCQETAESCGKPGWTTLYGRLGQALKSDAYEDFHLGQLTQVNIVEVSG